MFSFFVSEILQKIILLMLWECEIIIHAFFFLNGVISYFNPLSNYSHTFLYNISNLTTSKVSCSSDSAQSHGGMRRSTQSVLAI